VRGTPQVHELAGRTLFVLPLLHPAAALRTPSLLETLREDFGVLAALLDEPLPEPAPAVEPGLEPGESEHDSTDQLDLFGG
jgi:DNA polymerase